MSVLAIHQGGTALIVNRKAASISLLQAFPGKMVAPDNADELFYYQYGVFLRCPVQRLISLWRGEIAGKNRVNSRFRPWNWTGGTSFEQLALDVCATPDNRSDHHFRSQTCDILRHLRHRPGALFVGKLSTIAQDWSRFCHWAGLPVTEVRWLNQSHVEQPEVPPGVHNKLVARYRADWDWIQRLE